MATEEFQVEREITVPAAGVAAAAKPRRKAWRALSLGGVFLLSTLTVVILAVGAPFVFAASMLFGAPPAKRRRGKWRLAPPALSPPI